jgi:hypothetical protein
MRGLAALVLPGWRRRPLVGDNSYIDAGADSSDDQVTHLNIIRLQKEYQGSNSLPSAT